MHQGVQAGEREKEEDVHRRLDRDLGVARWGTPVRAYEDLPAGEPGAPSWWHGDEDASQSFLSSQGVTLSG